MDAICVLQAHPSTFKTATGVNKIEMMESKQRFPYQVYINRAHDEDGHGDPIVVRAPYKHTDDLAMYLLLPAMDKSNTDGDKVLEALHKLERELISNPEKFKYYARETRGRRDVCTLYLPKFELNVSMKLRKVLETLGMTDMFQRGEANFDNMFVNDTGTEVSRVAHQTFIKVVFLTSLHA